jgi:predicted ABC-type ATPase
MRPGKRTIQRRHERQRAAGLRSVSPSKAVNASLDKTYQELVDEGHFKHPTKPHVAGKPIAVAHSAPDLARLEEIVERGWMRGESPQRRVYFFPEGHESYIDWEGDYAWDFEDPFVDAGVAAQVTPKKPITIFHEDKHGSVDAQIAKQLGISESELKSTLMEQSELVPGTSEVADTARAAKPAEGDEHRSPLNLHRAFGVDLYADYTDNEDDGGNGHSLRGHMGSEIIVMDKDIIEVVGVRETGWTEEQIASHGGRRLYRGRNWEQGRDREVFDEDKFQEWRARTNELASSGMRSQRLTRADLDQRRDRTPKQNLSELGEAIDEYVGFLQEHHRHNFAGDGDVISAIDASDPGLVDEHDRLKSRVADLAGVFEEARVDLHEMDFERDELQDEVNRLVKKFDKANGEFLGSHSNNQMQRRQIVRAARDGEDRDKFLQSEFPDEMADDQGHMEWLWDTVVEERKEIMDLNKKLEDLEGRIGEESLGSEATLESLHELVKDKLAQWSPSPEAPIALGPGNLALNPGTGMRSRRDALSGSNREWLNILQANPGLWDEAPAAVRNVSSTQLRQEAMDLRGSSIRNTGGMRSGGRQKGQEILGKVKPEHKNKPSGERTLYFIGGTTGAGKSTIIKDKKVKLPDATEAAHIDPDDIKTGLRGWDPQNPGNVHHESRRVTDRVMDDAMNGGMDVVVQGTGKRDEHLREAKRRGYRTAGHFVYVPDKEADRRIAQRTADGGPNIPTHFGSLIGGELRNGIVSRQVTQGLYDEFHLWDNTGREPRLIAYRTQDGQFAINGREEFNNFFGASGRHVESYWQKNK